jgi:PTS system mannose-specific IIA component/PTS system mannose-specific IIB component
MIAGILIGHGELPQVLNRTIQKIIGVQDNFQVLSNENYSAAELQNQLGLAIQELGNKDVIIFVDLYGGSCANVSNQLLKKPRERQISIICGVNPAMLIKYFQYRDQKSFAELLQLLEETGRNEIRVIK